MIHGRQIFDERILRQHTACLGKTGSGKTTTAKLIIEQAVSAGARACILDPVKSDWWGLTSSADGKRPGLPFQILGGPHGHVPLHAGAGAAVAELVANGSLPLSIIDMADFRAGGLQQFFVDFAPVLIRKNRGVLYLVMEEAHEFAPKERSGIGAENMAIHFAKKLAIAGRSKGIRIIVCTQSTQSLHNSLLGSCDTMITHRITAPANQEPVLKWFKANADTEKTKTVSSSMSSMKTGEAWICSGEAEIFERRQFPKAQTYDNSATPDGNVDMSAHGVMTAAVDQDALRALIGTAVKEAEDNDPKLLKAKVAQLERERTQEKAHPLREVAIDVASLQRADKAGYDRARIEIGSQLANLNTELHHIAEWATKAAGKSLLPSGTATPDYSFPHGTKPRAIDGRTDAPPRIPIHYHTPRKVQTSESTVVRPAADPLPKGEQMILTACAQHEGGCTREQLTVLTGYKKSTRNAYIQRLQEKAAVTDENGRIMAAAYGFAILGQNFEPLPTGAALRTHWLHTLTGGERDIFNIVVETYPDAISRERITDLSGYKKSTRNAYIQRLAKRELVSGDDKIIASGTLF